MTASLAACRSRPPPEQPLPVRRVSQLLTQWIDRLGAVWVEGQVTQVTRRPGPGDRLPDAARPRRRHVGDRHLPPRAARRDPRRAARGRARRRAREGRGSSRAAARCRSPPTRSGRSASASCSPASSSCAPCSPPRVCSPPTASEPLPFLPAVVGLICGRASAAEKDVVENAKRRWPAVQFRIEEVAVQGPSAVTEVTRGAATTRGRPGGRRHRHHPRRRARSRTCCRSPTRRSSARSPPAARRSSARSATSRTPRCSTSSPTSAPRRRPTPPSESCPTSARSSTASPPPGAGCTVADRPPASTARPRPCSRCAAGRASPSR